MTTLAQCCQEVSTLLGDLELGTVGTAVTTTVTTITDPQRQESDGHWTGGWITINGEEQRILSSTTAGGIVTNPFVTAITPGMAYEIRKLGGHRRSAIITLLNQAVRNYESASWIQLDSRVDLADTTVFNPTTGGVLARQAEYPVPVDLLYVHAVLWQDKDDPTLPWYRLVPELWTTHGTGTVLIQQYDDRHEAPSIFAEQTIPDGAPLKFVGSRPPKPMVGDSSTCEVAANAAIYYAAARMCLRLAKGSQDNDDYKTKFAQLFQLEQKEERSGRLRLHGQSRRVR